MKTQNIIFTILPYCLFLVCCNSSNNKNNNKGQTSEARYIIDIDNGVEELEELDISTFIKGVRPILLEETDFALIGDIYGMKVFNSEIFILDMMIAKKLFVYDMNGKFLRQIGSMGGAAFEYRWIADFCIDPEKNEIYLLDNTSNKLLKHRIDDGKHLETVFLPQGIIYSEIAYVDGCIYAGITHDNPEDGDNLLLKFDLKTKKFEECLSAKTFGACWNHSINGGFLINYQPKLNQPKYIGLYTNTVFVCDRDSVYPYMTVKSKNWVQCGDIPNDAEDMGTSAVAEKGRTFWISYYFENDTCLYFTCNKGWNNCNILYNKQTQAVYLYKSIKNDIEFNNEAGKEFYIHPVLLKSVNSKFAYNVSYTSEALRISHEKNRLSQNLAKQVETMNLPDEGYVLFEYELK
jgi:hypothetical protein